MAIWTLVFCLSFVWRLCSLFMSKYQRQSVSFYKTVIHDTRFGHISYRWYLQWWCTWFTDTCQQFPWLCDVNARCVYDDNIQEYICRCNPGFQGDGRRCTGKLAVAIVTLVTHVAIVSRVLERSWYFGVNWSKHVLNLSEIDQSPAELLIILRISADVVSRCDLSFWSLDLEFLPRFDYHACDLCTKFARNRISYGWVIDNLSCFRRAILGGK